METSLPKMGAHLVSVASHHTLALGKHANCQTLVSLTLASLKVAVMVGLGLFQPER